MNSMPIRTCKGKYNLKEVYRGGGGRERNKVEYFGWLYDNQ